MTTSSPSSLQALLRLIKYARHYRKPVILASLSSMINKLFDIMPEILIGIAIDVVVNQEQSFIATLGFTTPHAQIMVLGVLTFLIWAGESLFEYFYLILWRNLGQNLQSDLRQSAYNHVQRLDMSFFESKSSGELVSIINDDVNQLERFLDGGANSLIQVFVTIIAVGGVFFIISPTIALLAFAPIPIIIAAAFYFLRKATPLYANVRHQVGQLAARLSNNITGMATIKSFTAEEDEAKHLKEVSHRYVEANKQAIAVSSAFIPLVRMAILAGFLATFILGGLWALEGKLNVGAYGVLVFLTQRLLWPLTGLAQTVDLFERAMASTRRVLDLINTPINVPDHGVKTLPAHPSSDSSQQAQGKVTFKHLSFHYPNSNIGIHDININIAAGHTLALVGTTGSGKSTLIKLLLRFYTPNKGDISIDDQPINEFSLQSLRKAIGLVSQDVFLFEGSIRDNIAYGKPHAQTDEIINAAKTAEIWTFIESLPQGLDTEVGERGIKLSGGQRQRLSLARALLKNPLILVLDEATSAVDNETEAAIQRSLKHIAHHRTVIMIAHRLSTIVHADKIAVIKDGHLIEQGTHKELLTQKGEYWSQWQVQTGGEHA